MRHRDVLAARGATLFERTLAYLFDALLTFLLWIAVILSVARDPDRLTDDAAYALIAGMLFLVVPFTYFVLLEGLTGTTPGKAMLGLRIVNNEGRPAGLFAATVRNTLRLAWALGPVGPAFLLLDVVLIQNGENDRRLGDAAAETRVVRSRRGLLALD